MTLQEYVINELMENKKVKVTVDMAGSRTELLEFIDEILSATTQHWIGGNVYAEPTYNGFIIFEN